MKKIINENRIDKIIQETINRMILENGLRQKDQLSESYGFFDGCRELAVKIFDKIYDNWKGKDNLTKMDYLIVPCEWASRGRIVILPTKVNVRAGYVYARHQVNGDTVICVNPIVINEDESTFLPTLEHELTHAYEDSMRINGGSSMLKAAIESGYDKVFKYKFNGARMENDSIAKQDLGSVLYWFASFEQNAFFAGMFGRLIHGYAEPENANECLEVLKGTREYNSFSNMIYIVKEILTKKTRKESQDALVDCANKLTNISFRTYGQLCKWLLYKANKLERKLNVMLPKMVKRYFEMVEHDEI